MSAEAPSAPREAGDAIVQKVARLLADLPAPAAVAIDGGDGAGKTTFARQLVAGMASLGRAVVHVSIDDFHHPRNIRYRQGRDSPEGCYHEGYDYHSFLGRTLEPYLAGASEIAIKVLDLERDEAELQVAQVPDGALLLVDGVFLQRPGLRDYWARTIWIEASFEARHQRAALRDGSASVPGSLRSDRYVNAHRLYREEADPISRSDLVIDNEDLNRRTIARAPGVL